MQQNECNMHVIEGLVNTANSFISHNGKAKKIVNTLPEVYNTKSKDLGQTIKKMARNGFIYLRAAKL